MGFVMLQKMGFLIVLKLEKKMGALILEKVSMVGAEEVEELTDTERGAGGFGSTGVKN